MTLRVLLVDDELHSREYLAALLSGVPDVTVAGTASSGEAALACLHQTDVDLVFLDIEMEDVNGFDLARHIQTAYPKVLIVFLTGHVDFALEGYEFHPLDFLIKPLNLIQLERVLLHARNLLENQEQKISDSVRIGLQVDGGLEIIQVNHILYVEKQGRKVYLVSVSGRRYQSSDSLQKLQSILESYGFFRCHQSFLVQVEAIRSIILDASKHSYNLVLDRTDQLIPLSRDNYKELRERLAGSGVMII